MKIFLSQSNPIVGNFSYNSQLIISAAEEAANNGASLLVTPELSLTGYPPEDLLLRDSFLFASGKELLKLADKLSIFKGLNVVVGHPEKYNNKNFNKISILFEGNIISSYAKQKLPNVDVFDEFRYFTSGSETLVIEIKNYKIGFLICEDVWHSTPALDAKKRGAELLISVNASPYHCNKRSDRINIIKKRIQETKLPFIYLNAVGGQDELVFDGGSFVINNSANVTHYLDQFASDSLLIEYIDHNFKNPRVSNELSLEEEIYKALVLGVKDYVFKNNFPGVIIGLSGGVDSALVAAIAVDALGPKNVRALMMPSQYTAEISKQDAEQLAINLGIKYDVLPINDTYNVIEKSLDSQFKYFQKDTTEENIQARIRGLFLMALSNKTNWMVLTTGNKSELAVGYCTLYGDMAGGFAVIKDITKTLVYRLCKYKNQHSELIPRRILLREPSAELKYNQRDVDSLPPYSILDAIINKFVEENQSMEEIIASGFEKEIVVKVVKLIFSNEYKRRQSPVGIRITKKAFGRDWRYPITNIFRM